MNKDFAKIYYAPEIGQILVTVNSDGTDSDVTFQFRSSGVVASASVSFDSAEDASNAFEKLDEEAVVAMVENLSVGAV